MSLNLNDQNSHMQLFQDLLKADKQSRTTAEEQIQNLKKIDFNQSIQVFNTGMSSQTPEIRQLAALLLKKNFLEDKNILANLTADNLNVLEKVLKQNIDFENKEFKTLQRIGEGMAILYSGSDLKNCFNDIIAWFSSSLPIARRFAVFLIESLCELRVLTDEVVKNSVSEFLEIFRKGLSDPDTNVKVNSLKATSGFLNNLTKKDVIMKFQELAQTIIESLVVVLKTDTESGKLSLQALVDLAESQGKFWKDNLDELVNVVCEIAKETSFENEIREISLEIVYSLAKATPVNMRKCKVLKSTFIPLLFHLMCDLDNVKDLEAWTETNEEDEIDFTEMFYGTVEGLGRLCHDLGGKYMLENSFGYIETFLNENDWIKNHSALSSMGWMAAGCYEQFKTNMKDILNHVSVALIKDHPRVRYAALVCLSFLLEDLSPVLQNKYYSNIMPALCKLISAEEPNIRVRMQACRTFKVFLGGVDHEDFDYERFEKMKPYIHNAMEILPGLLEQSITSNNLPLQEETLSTLSRIASHMEKDFYPYYKLLMPGLKKIIFEMEMNTGEKKTLKSNAIETLSTLCSAVSEQSEEFIEEFKELTEKFVMILQNIKEEDSLTVPILNAFTHISHSMMEEFYPYLDKLLPMLEKYIEADIDAKAEDNALRELMPQEQEKGKISLTLFKNSNKNISLNTFAYQNKVMAAEVLYEISLNMGASFAPYLEKYLNITKKNLRCLFASKVRKFSFKSIYSAIMCCKNDIEQKKVLELIGNDILQVLRYNTESRLFREVKHGLKVLTHTFEEIKNKNVFSENFITELYAIFKRIIVECEEVKNIQKTKIKDEDAYDENDEGQIAADIDTLNEIIRRVMETNGFLFQTFKEDLTDIVQNNLSEIFHKNWVNAIQNTKVDQEVLNSICFFSDILECGKFEVNKLSYFFLILFFSYFFFFFCFFLFKILLKSLIKFFFNKFNK